MLVDATVARSFAVLGWSGHLVAACGGRVLIAHGVLGASADEPSELRRIHDALDREANDAGLGSGVGGRALAAAQGLEDLMALGADSLQILLPIDTELAMAIRLQSREPADRAWRQGLGARSRRLDAGEATSIAIANHRELDFATDDEEAVRLYESLTHRRWRPSAGVNDDGRRFPSEAAKPTKEDLHPCRNEYLPRSGSAPRSTSCSLRTVS